jgi:NitT/TauT family transport system permease protein
LTRRWSDVGLPLSVGAGFITLWEIASRLSWINPVLVSSPTRVLRAGAALLREPTLGADLAYSLQVFSLAMLLATAVGLTLGLLIGYSRLAHGVVHPFIVVFNALPKVALLPLVVLWVGIGRPAGVLLATLMAAFPVIIATSSGLRALERDYVLVARAFGATPWFLVQSVVLPGVSPYLVSGLRVGVNYALVGVILAEFFASSRGIGYRMLVSMANFEVDAFFVCLSLVGAFALSLTLLLQRIERKLEARRADAFEPAL